MQPCHWTSSLSRLLQTNKPQRVPVAYELTIENTVGGYSEKTMTDRGVLLGDGVAG